MSQHDDYELSPEEERLLLRFLAGSATIREVLASSGPDWLIEGWLASSATMVAGSPESGKSSLVASMAAAVASGDSWLDAQVTTDRTGPVIIMTTDPADSGQWAKKGRDLGVADDRWELIAFTPERWASYADLAEGLDARLLVFDNITSGLDGPINEADPSSLLGPLGQLVSAGTPVVVIAHSGKGGSKDPMGPTAYKAWRRHGIHVSGVGEQRTLTRAGNQGNWPTVVVNGTPRGAAVDYTLVSEQATRSRSPERLGQNVEIARWVVDECQGVGVNEAAKRIAAEFPGVKDSTRRQHLLQGPLSKLLERSGEHNDTRWSLIE
ncbi:AAA family ATPase [Mycobacterium sp. UM_Kg27]|uniref:AAA family ATPase n=1 Tax=Mycobacterium sp. UM_Kg27 TaxID=1545693 RepID=UPI000A4E8CC8|nr:AAA family ATPase [Mycobacterium sp. UM_Kg27]